MATSGYLRDWRAHPVTAGRPKNKSQRAMIGILSFRLRCAGSSRISVTVRSVRTIFWGMKPIENIDWTPATKTGRLFA